MTGHTPMRGIILGLAIVIPLWIILFVVFVKTAT